MVFFQFSDVSGLGVFGLCFCCTNPSDFLGWTFLRWLFS